MTVKHSTNNPSVHSHEMMHWASLALPNIDRNQEFSHHRTRLPATDLPAP